MPGKKKSPSIARLKINPQLPGAHGLYFFQFHLLEVIRLDY